MVDDFIDRKHGRKQVTYDFPELKEILEETYGVIVYQEQVMQISNRLAGYSLGDADLLRRAMGKKKAEEMAKQRERFVAGAREKGLAPKKVEKIFDLMEQFAGYGFNKSHSAAYAYLAYVTAYLKAHYPLEFLSALLTSETGNTGKIVKYINEAPRDGDCAAAAGRQLERSRLHPLHQRREAGHPVRPVRDPQPGRGGGGFDHGRARRRRAVTRSFYDFCERVDLSAVNRRVLESLIKAGRPGQFGGNRAQLCAVIDQAMESGQRVWKDAERAEWAVWRVVCGRDRRQRSSRLPHLPDWTPQQKLSGEKEMLGIYVTGHPLDEHNDKVCELATHTTDRLEGLEKGNDVALCGILTGIQRKRNKEGKLWAALQIEDREGSVEGMVFSTQYDRLLNNLVEDKAVLIRGLVLPEENGPPKISVQDIIPLEVARVNLPTLDLDPDPGRRERRIARR